MEDMPELYLDSVCFWEAFQYLNTSRELGFNEGYIKCSEVLAYLQINYITDLEERQDYMNFIQVLDQHYINRKQEKKQLETLA